MQAPGQVQRGSGEGSEGSGEGVGGFGAEPGQVQQGSGEGSREALVQRQVRFNRVPDKVPEKVSGSLGAKQSQVQRGPEKVAEQVPEKVLGIFGAGPGQDRVSSAWLRSTLQKDF